MTKFLLLLLVASTQLFANEGTRFFEKYTTRYVEYSTVFKVNKELGRAWVVITETNNLNEEVVETEIPVNVKGLSFNKATNEVTYKSTVCATYSQSRRYSTITTTSNCAVKTSYSTEEYDNGFSIKTRLKVDFSLRI